VTKEANCEHQNFNAFANVGRMLKEDGDKMPAYYLVELKIECRDCGQQLEFVGLPHGVSAYQPMVSLNGDEARLPMVIPGEQVPAGLPGFGVRFRAGDEPKGTQ
jgi:hypothetical protein